MRQKQSLGKHICDAGLTAAQLVWLVAAVVVLIADVLQRDALAVAAFQLVIRAGSMSGTLAFEDGGIRIEVSRGYCRSNEDSAGPNSDTYSSPASHRSRRRSRPPSCTARGCICSGCCRSEIGTASHTGCPLQIQTSNLKFKSPNTYCCECAKRQISYSTSEAPHPNCLRSRCRHRTSTEAAHKRGSCTQTGRGGSRCRWKSGELRGQNRSVRVSRTVSEWADPVRAEALTARRLVREVQAVWVAIALEALSDAMAAAALEVTGVTSP